MLGRRPRPANLTGRTFPEVNGLAVGPRQVLPLDVGLVRRDIKARALSFETKMAIVMSNFTSSCLDAGSKMCQLWGRKGHDLMKLEPSSCLISRNVLTEWF